MQQDFTRLSVPLSSYEQEGLRKDLNQGCWAILLPAVIIVPFIWMFVENIPQDTLWGKLFVWVPLAVAVGVTVFLIYYLNALRMDLKAGEKIAVKGPISKKYIRVTRKLKNSRIRNLSDRMRHFIVVNGKRYLIKGFEYDSCSVGQQVTMYVTPYSKRVLDLQLADTYVNSGHHY